MWICMETRYWNIERYSVQLIELKELLFSRYPSARRSLSPKKQIEIYLHILRAIFTVHDHSVHIIAHYT